MLEINLQLNGEILFDDQLNANGELAIVLNYNDQVLKRKQVKALRDHLNKVLEDAKDQ